MSDLDLQKFVENIVQDDRAMELVTYIHPLEIVKVFVKDFDLCPKDASKVTANLLKHRHDPYHEGMSIPAIETNKEYPVPPEHRKDPPLIKFKKSKSESALARPQGKVDITPKHDYQRHEFPPDPRSEPDDWPYDAMTKASMKPKTPDEKKPLNTAKKNEPRGSHKKYVFKNPMHTNHGVRQPGGDGAGGKGIYQKGSVHNKHNSTPSQGRSWSKRGYAGWSSSPSGKEFDLPPPKRKENKQKEPEFLKDPPVGASVPRFGNGGRSSAPYRHYKRR